MPERRVARPMHLIEILLPLKRNDGSPQPPDLFERVKAELVERFGGLTAFTRSPADGLWNEGGGTSAERDLVLLFEVMADELDSRWWADYRSRLERDFGQESIMIRASRTQTL